MIKSYEPMNKENANQLLSDIKHTIDLNKNEIINLLIKNCTISMEINFKIEAASVITMDIITAKAVISDDEIVVEKKKK